MKVLIFLSALFSLSAISKAQCLLDSINQWYLFQNVCPVKTSNESTSKPLYGYSTGEDTVLSGIVYYSVYEIEWGGTTQLFGFIREDSLCERVFFKGVTDSTEMILYDFGLDIGDSLTLTFSSDGIYKSGIYRLDSVRTVTLNSEMRDVYYLNNLEANNSNMLVWVRGIGQLSNPFYLKNNSYNGGCYFYSCTSPQLGIFLNPIVTCFEHDKKVYFNSCTFSEAVANMCINIQDSCNYYNICSGLPETSSLEFFRIYPNPIRNSHLNITVEIKKEADFNFILTNINGEALREAQFGRLYPGTYNMQMNISGLSPGFYMLRYQSEAGWYDRKLIVY